MKAIAIILAAGESRRMGSPKALLEAAPGVTFLELLTQTFLRAGLAPLVVLGAQAGLIGRAHPAVPRVLNRHWPQGQLSSVRVGLRAALSQGAERILIHPVDAPLISAATAARVLEALSSAQAIVPVFQGRPGHPLGLRAAAARLILTLSADTLEQAAAGVSPRPLAVDDPATIDNLNSPEAYSLCFGGAASGLLPPNS